MLHDEINVARVPKHVGVDRGMHYVSEFLRRNGLDTVVHMIRRLGIPDLIRTLNTKPKKQQKPVVDHTYLVNYFKEDVARLSTMLDRDLGTEWGIVDTHNSL